MESATEIVALCVAALSFVSSFMITVINNCHNREIKRIEVEFEMHKTHLNLQYEHKSKLYEAVTVAAGSYSISDDYANLSELRAAIGSAILVASPTNQNMLMEFLHMANNLSYNGCSYDECEEIKYKYIQDLCELSIALNAELKSDYVVVTKQISDIGNKLQRRFKAH